MDVSLPADLERFVHEQIRRGDFSTEAEVICEALRPFERDRQSDRSRLEELRQFVAVGLEQAERGEVRPLDMAEVRAEGRRRTARRDQGE